MSRFLRPVRAKSTRSLRPSLSSGIPDSIVFSLILPTISLLITLPLAFTCKHTQTHTYTLTLQETHNAQVSHTHQNINGLNDIYKDFIFLVFDALGPPRHSVCHCGGYFGLGHLKLIALLCYVSDDNTKHHHL